MSLNPDHDPSSSCPLNLAQCSWDAPAYFSGTCVAKFHYVLTLLKSSGNGNFPQLESESHNSHYTFGDLRRIAGGIQ